MISNKWLRVALALAVGAVGALGIGPVLITMVTDLQPELSVLSMSTAVFVFLVGSLSSVLFFLWCREFGGVNIPRRRLTMILLTAVTLVSVGMILASTIDAANTSAWRYARLMMPEPGFSGRTDIVDRLHYLRLSSSADYKGGGEIAMAGVSWPVWLVGGNAKLLLRVPDAQNGAPCRGLADIIIDVDDRHALSRSVTVPSAELCNQWRRIELKIPRRSSLIKFGFVSAGGEFQSEQRIDIAILDLSPNLAYLWTVATIIAFGLLLAFVYGAVSPHSEREVADVSERRSNGLMISGVTLLFVLVSNAFVFWFVSQEETIYTWDTAGYWTSSRHVSDILRGGPSDTRSNPGIADSSNKSNTESTDFPRPARDPVTSLVRNVRYSEYNITNNLPVALAMVAFSGSRMVYELSLTNIYALPAVLVLLLALSGMARVSVFPWAKWWPVVPVLVVLGCIPFWVPLVRGYIGVCVVAINLAVLWLYFTRSDRSRGVPLLACIGLLLAVSVLLQRWNAYWIVAFMMIAFLDSIRALWDLRSYQPRDIIRYFQAPVLAGVTALAILAVVAWPLVITMATTDYADIYSAFAEHTSYYTALEEIVQSFGLIWLILFVAAVVYLISKKSTRYLTALLTLQIVIMFLHFSSTQTMGPHHLYVLMPGAFLILSMAAVELLSDRQRIVNIAGMVMLSIYVANGLVSGVAVFAPSGDSVRTLLMPMVPDDRRTPLVRQDLNGFARLTAYVDKLLADDSSIKGVYVLSSSQILNVVHLRNLEASTGISFRSAGNLLRSSEIDKRDGFPRNLLHADLVIVSDPVQYNRRPSDQHVVGVPARDMLGRKNIGAAFRQMPVSFKLQDDVNVLIFKREREISSSDIAGLSDSLRAIYPDRPKIYKH